MNGMEMYCHVLQGGACMSSQLYVAELYVILFCPSSSSVALHWGQPDCNKAMDNKDAMDKIVENPVCICIDIRQMPSQG